MDCHPPCVATSPPVTVAVGVNVNDTDAAPAICTFPDAASVNTQSAVAAPKIREPITASESNANESVPAVAACADIATVGVNTFAQDTAPSETPDVDDIAIAGVNT